LTGVKIPKLATLIMRPRYPYIKQIKIDSQFSTDIILNDKIRKKNSIKKTTKKQHKSTGVNPLSSIPKT